MIRLWHHFQRLFLSQKSIGNVAWLWHRLTGIALALYLIPHFISIHSAMEGPNVFDETLATYQSPFYAFCEWMLILTVAYHAANGLRIIAMDLFNLSSYQKWFFGFVIAICLTVFILSSFLFVPRILKV